MAAEVHKVQIFMKRRPGMSVEAFRDHYENRHVPLCMPFMGPTTRGYVRRYIETMTDPATGEPQEFDYDVITELTFADRESLDLVLNYAGKGILPPEIIADEERFLDRSKTRFTWVTECETELRG